MSTEKVGRTALGAAICRLIEQYEPEPTRLFTDPFVRQLISKPMQYLYSIRGLRSATIQNMDSLTKGIYGSQVCRTRYINEAAARALVEGIRQVIILGAGFDARPYYLPGMERCRVIEIDLAAVQREKKQRIKKALGRLPEHVSYLPIDFEKQTLEEVLAGSSYDPARPVLFIWEAVTQYLDDAAVQRTLGCVAKAAPGSQLVFTYILKSVIERRSDIPGSAAMLDFFKNDTPWTFGLEPGELAGYLKAFQLDLLDDAGSAEYEERYLQPIARQLSITPIERSALAVKNGG